MEKTVKFTIEQLNNLVQFLDRVEYKGFVEVKAINEIMEVLTAKEEIEPTVGENEL